MCVKLMSSSSPTTTAEKTIQHAFWNTQPISIVPHSSSSSSLSSIGDKTITNNLNTNTFPIYLPDTFEWDLLDVSDEKVLDEIFLFLRDNYVRNDQFRFEYSREFLKWTFQSDSQITQEIIILGLRRSQGNRKLCAMISSIPCWMSLNGQNVLISQINFLCVHRLLRGKRLTPVLIREISRRVCLQGIKQSVFTSGSLFTRPVSKCSYWHRPLNIKKLIHLEFSHVKQGWTMGMMDRYYRLPSSSTSHQFQKLTTDDVKEASQFFSKHISKYDLRPLFSQQKFEETFLPRNDVISTYIRKEDGQIVDFVSFFCICSPSSISSSSMSSSSSSNVNSSIKSAFSFYNLSSRSSIQDLIQNALILSKSEGFDVFTCLDVMNNQDAFGSLKFEQGSGILHYYVYNWSCESLKPPQIGLILV